jgi:uncharacterized protein (TIGR02284 family)
MDPEHVISTLNELIEVSKDGEYGFRICAQKSNSPNLVEIFSHRADECRKAASELEQYVVDWGEAPTTRGSVAGSLQRGWIGMRSALSSNDDQALLEECERGEDVAMDSYQKAIDRPLPVAVRPIIERQYLGAMHNQNQIRELRASAR